MTAMNGIASTKSRTRTPGQLRDLRTALEQQHAFRTEQLAELAGTAASRSIGDPHDEVLDVLHWGAASALREIELALARMDAGLYGICGTCRGTIPLERLEILPMAVSCMTCAREHHANALGQHR
jgi:DnaK suppressor protein